jgi:uncharacterized protein YfaA (DUF2138 family)
MLTRSKSQPHYYPYTGAIFSVSSQFFHMSWESADNPDQISYYHHVHIDINSQAHVDFHSPESELTQHAISVLIHSIS